MKACKGCGHRFDHRMVTNCPSCGEVPATLQALRVENAKLRIELDKEKRRADAYQDLCDQKTATLRELNKIANANAMAWLAERDKNIELSMQLDEIEGAWPSDFNAFAQANCEHRDSHGKPAPAPAPLPTCKESLQVQNAPAPLPGGKGFTFDCHTHALNFIAASLTDLGGEQEALDAVCSHITAQAARLAEVEEELKRAQVSGLKAANECGMAKAQRDAAQASYESTMAVLNATAQERDELRQKYADTRAMYDAKRKECHDAQATVARILADVRGKCEK